MASVFDIREHEVEGQHIREYPRATAHSLEETLSVAVKQYIPKDNKNPQPGDVTIIGAHANGFPKELYEAMWEDLYYSSKQRGFRIRSIWIADVAWQGQSSVVNEGKLGNDPSWFDHSRDLLHMINKFRSSMPQPIVAIGHSFGGNILTNLALFHPSLFTTMVLLDPVIYHFEMKLKKFPTPLPHLSTYRRDLWPSREVAAEGFRKSPFYASWDKRVLDAWIKYGLRDTPTAIYPSEKSGVTLTTTKHQEVFTFVRPLYTVKEDTGEIVIDRSKLPDLDPNISAEADENSMAFYQPEGAITFTRLPNLRPSVLWIFGEESDVSEPEQRKQKMEVTGTGVGGSGGAAAGRVKEVLLEKTGHLVAMEKPKACADNAAEWIGQELGRWREAMKEYETWVRKDDVQKPVVDDAWLKMIGGPPGRNGGKPKERL